MHFYLPIHDTSDAVARNVSSTFKSRFKPINDGTTIDGNAANSDVFVEIRFRAATAKIYILSC